MEATRQNFRGKKKCQFLFCLHPFLAFFCRDATRRIFARHRVERPRHATFDLPIQKQRRGEHYRAEHVKRARERVHGSLVHRAVQGFVDHWHQRLDDRNDRGHLSWKLTTDKLAPV